MIETRLVDIGGRNLALTASGDGSPNVVLETGLGMDADGWEAVQTQVAPVTRVLRYDRAGRGQSDPAPQPRSAQRMVADLSALLDLAGLTGPYVLVGQSFGGIVARIFAGQHPEMVAGVVLVDPAVEGQFEQIAAALPPENPQDPPSLRQFRQFWSQDYRDPGKNREGIDFLSSFEQVCAEKFPLGIPMVVLTSGNLLPELAGYPVEAQRCREIWWDLQDRVARLASNPDHRLVENSGHFIQRDQPGAVAAAILEIVQKARHSA